MMILSMREKCNFEKMQKKTKPFDLKIILKFHSILTTQQSTLYMFNSPNLQNKKMIFSIYIYFTTLIAITRPEHTVVSIHFHFF